MGRALLTNKSLIEIHLKNNMIDPVGCFTICVGARETTSLRILNLDGNPIGEAGARALMTIPLVCGARLEFSAKGEQQDVPKSVARIYVEVIALRYGGYHYDSNGPWRGRDRTTGRAEAHRPSIGGLHLLKPLRPRSRLGGGGGADACGGAFGQFEGCASIARALGGRLTRLRRPKRPP